MRLLFRRAEIAGERGEIETTPLPMTWSPYNDGDAAFPQNDRDAIILESYKADSRDGFTARYVNDNCLRSSYGIIVMLFW